MIWKCGPLQISNKSMVGWVVQFETKNNRHRWWKKYRKLGIHHHVWNRKVWK